MDEVAKAELLLAPPPYKPPKSPPLAFEPTPNDALAPLKSPPHNEREIDYLSAPTGHNNTMPNGSLSADGAHLQRLVDRQANAIHLLHEAFGAERQAWSLERESLYRRIASLEKLLMANHWHSPAKSPVLSPTNGSSIASPLSRATSSAHRLPSIAEDDNALTQTLSQRREGAPSSIDLSSIPTIAGGERQRNNSVTFENDLTPLQVQEIPISPVPSTTTASPSPLQNRRLAGHTPLKAPRPPTPPPNNISLDSIEDTPTRNNTHINAFLTQSKEDEEDKALKGPLNMPELPHMPDQSNFTMEMLSKKLQSIAQSPDESSSKPSVFFTPSPGLAVSGSPHEDASPRHIDSTIEGSKAPVATRDLCSQSDSNAITSSAMSPNSTPLSLQASHEEQVHNEFEQGGIKLKKKPSSNFGAPFGSVGGFARLRNLS